VGGEKGEGPPEASTGGPAGDSGEVVGEGKKRPLSQPTTGKDGKKGLGCWRERNFPLRTREGFAHKMCG